MAQSWSTFTLPDLYNLFTPAPPRAAFYAQRRVPVTFPLLKKILICAKSWWPHFIVLNWAGVHTQLNIGIFMYLNFTNNENCRWQNLAKRGNRAGVSKRQLQADIPATADVAVATPRPFWRQIARGTGHKCIDKFTSSWRWSGGIIVSDLWWRWLDAARNAAGVSLLRKSKPAYDYHGTIAVMLRAPFESCDTVDIITVNYEVARPKAFTGLPHYCAAKIAGINRINERGLVIMRRGCP